MACVNGDSTAQYFKKGADVEISSDDEGFRGSWYAGTIIRPPGNSKRSTNKVLVEYNNLMADEAGTQRLREELDVVQLRPPPPREKFRIFKFSEEVDAYYNDGWWEGIITAVTGNKYSVFFRGTREQIDFKASDLRLHREWVYENWVPPLEPSPGVAPKNEKLPLSAEVEANKKMIEHNFSLGELVEVSSDEEGYEGAWFVATLIKELNKGRYLVEYQSLRNDEDTNFLREEVDNLHIRPCPSNVSLVDRYEVHDEVDALYNDGWWVGVISKVLKNNRYSVYFRNTHEELNFKHYDLRMHQEWINGKWIIPSKASLLGSDKMFRLRSRLVASNEVSKKLGEWEKQVLALTDDLAKERILRNEMSVELENLKNAHITEIEKACKAAREEAVANFSHPIKGIALMDDNYKCRHEAFLQSPEHQEMLVDSALQYYYHGFCTCVKQLVDAGHLTSNVDISFLQEGAGLDDALEPCEEAPACVLAIHTTTGGQTECSVVKHAPEPTIDKATLDVILITPMDDVTIHKEVDVKEVAPEPFFEATEELAP